MNSQESGILGTCHCKNFGVRLVIKEPKSLMGRRGPSSQPLHLDRSLNLYSGFYKKAGPGFKHQVTQVLVISFIHMGHS